MKKIYGNAIALINIVSIFSYNTKVKRAKIPIKKYLFSLYFFHKLIIYHVKLFTSVYTLSKKLKFLYNI